MPCRLLSSLHAWLCTHTHTHTQTAVRIFHSLLFLLFPLHFPHCLFGSRYLTYVKSKRCHWSRRSRGTPIWRSRRNVSRVTALASKKRWLNICVSTFGMCIARRRASLRHTNAVLSGSASAHFPVSSPQMSDNMFQLQAKRIRVCGSPLTDISNQKGNEGNAKETTGTTSYEISWPLCVYVCNNACKLDKSRQVILLHMYFS